MSQNPFSILVVTTKHPHPEGPLELQSNFHHDLVVHHRDENYSSDEGVSGGDSYEIIKNRWDIAGEKFGSSTEFEKFLYGIGLKNPYIVQSKTARTKTVVEEGKDEFYVKYRMGNIVCHSRFDIKENMLDKYLELESQGFVIVGAGKNTSLEITRKTVIVD